LEEAEREFGPPTQDLTALVEDAAGAPLAPNLAFDGFLILLRALDDALAARVCLRRWVDLEGAMAMNEFAVLMGADPAFLLSSSVLRAWARNTTLPTNPTETAAVVFHLHEGFDASPEDGLSLHDLIETVKKASEHPSAFHAFDSRRGDAATSRH
jgi:hypothetical protein